MCSCHRADLTWPVPELHLASDSIKSSSSCGQYNGLLSLGIDLEEGLVVWEFGMSRVLGVFGVVLLHPNDCGDGLMWLVSIVWVFTPSWSEQTGGHSVQRLLRDHQTLGEAALADIELGLLARLGGAGGILCVALTLLRSLGSL